ncbi:(2Fe-2S)-binding protein [Streptomyces roseolilacinus]|uniref:Ferric siderophore reductase C-terminal domain-containing protein n=1 Tax=Streptomyces roseolilacinus TaxID=66904 RepID=A0A918B6A7_9ACTN|nr:(2Fe-2S)-binding protein [Streptomyces roseolilacinus]GGQ19916.1 hypothetical protein GCM10010249_43330 [Streptomyces roseolilacinus]
MTIADTLARVSATGPYFAVSCGPRADPGDFRPLTDLYTDREILSAQVADLVRRIGTDRRVAASALHLGTAARLWSIALATAALAGRVPDLTPDRLHWRATGSGTVELWLPEPAAMPGRDLPAALYETVAVRNLAPLGEALGGPFGLSPKLLRGNVASALAGAVRILRTHGPDTPHPPLPIAAALLERGPLADAGTLTLAPPAYRRRSCCLFYRVPGADYCGDCVLNRGEAAPL